MSKRILFFMFSLGLAVLLSAADSMPDKSQAADTEKSALMQASVQSEASGHEKTDAPPTTSGEKSHRVKATGRVRLVGSGALPELVLSQEGKQWYIAKEDMHKLNALQQQTVTLEGEESIRELRWANGRLAGKRRYLHNIQILTTE